MSLTRVALFVLVGAFGATSCAAVADPGFTPTGGAGGMGTTTTSATSTSGVGGGSGLGGSIGLGGSNGGGGQGGAGEGEIYVHDLTTLYRFEPISSHLTLIGTFDCVIAEPSGTSDGGMQDIALDKDDALYGVAKIAAQGGVPGQNYVVVSIDRTTAKCVKEVVIPKDVVEPNGYVDPRGLSFVPAGTIDPVEETLVALDIGGSYMKIDLATKTTTLIGNLNGSGPPVWTSKGADIVSIIGDQTYVTAKQQGELTDRLTVMDPVTGAISKSLGPTSIVTIGGLAYWGGTLYAFTVDAGAFAIDPKTGQTTPITITGAPAGLQYHGAGVTTAAPITIPK